MLLNKVLGLPYKWNTRCILLSKHSNIFQRAYISTSVATASFFFFFFLLLVCVMYSTQRPREHLILLPKARFLKVKAGGKEIAWKIFFGEEKKKKRFQKVERSVIPEVCINEWLLLQSCYLSLDVGISALLQDAEDACCVLGMGILTRKCCK